MVDSVQRISTVPLPDFQTTHGSHDPAPLEEPREQQRVTNQARGADRDNAEHDFSDYLNETSITMLERAQRNQRFDPVEEITSGSVYAQPKDRVGL